MYIIIGAGAAGLMAAKILSAQGKKVTILEAAQRIGGRIHTVQLPGFLQPVEAGAEFIHGTMPITLQLMEEARIDYVPITGNMWHHKRGKWVPQNEETEGWGEVIQRMQELKTDIPIADFLYQYFAGEQYAELRQSVQGFAEGFDLADIFTASTFALRNEWMNEDEEQYRIPNGYAQLTDYLINVSRQQGCEIITGCRVKHIEYETGNLTVTAADGRTFTGEKIVITVPLGILQQDENAENAISFHPAINTYTGHFKKMGYGGVIKIAIQFNRPFWESISNDMSFILTAQPIPTWWTQLSIRNNMLTGWLGGPAADGLRQTARQTIYQMAIQSLAEIFDKKNGELEDMLTGWEIFNWPADIFAAGAYSFSTLATNEALQTVMQPIDNTIYFAGEAFYNGEHPGTVEAALESGKRVGELINSNE
jgi:monoamine oxidase